MNNFIKYTFISNTKYIIVFLKEINEQPDAVLNSINKGGRIKNNAEVKLGGLEQHIFTLEKINNIIILGCGTSYFAGLYGMYYFKLKPSQMPKTINIKKIKKK